MADKWHKMIGRLKQEILDIGLVARAVTEGGLGYATESWSDAYDRIPLGSRAAAQSWERDYFSVYLRRCGHCIPESQCHSTFVILPDSTSISNGPHGRGKRYSASDTT